MNGQSHIPRRMDGWIGLPVTLNREIRTSGGEVYPACSYWRVSGHHRGKLSLLSGSEQIGGDANRRAELLKVPREWVSIVPD